MAYSESWDEAFPPDTQAANLLGDDIRTFKTAIRERVQSFGAGPLGSRPTPEAVWTGVMYFATDTGQIFSWNGASWDDITSDFFGRSVRVLFSDFTFHSHTIGTVEDTIYSTTITGGVLGTTRGLRVTVWGTVGALVSTSSLVRFKLGATTFANFTIQNGGSFKMEFVIGNRGAANSQDFMAWYFMNATGNQQVSAGSGVIDTSVDQPLNITVQNGNTNDAQNFYVCTVEIL